MTSTRTLPTTNPFKVTGKIMRLLEALPVEEQRRVVAALLTLVGTDDNREDVRP